MLTIEVYGPGCKKCTFLYQLVQDVLQEQNIEADLKKISDPIQFAQKGVLMTPALSINGKIIFSGIIPAKDELVKIILSENSDSSDMTKNKPACACQCACATTDNSEKEEASCCSKGAPCSIKKIITWILILIIILATIKIINRNLNPSPSEAPPTTQQNALQSGLKVTYYMVGAQCPTCTRMKQWTEKTLKMHFPQELKEGALIFIPEVPSEDTMIKYELTTKSIVIEQYENNQVTKSIVLDDLFDNNSSEEEFATYILEGINQLKEKVTN